jgi:hypothetical protein
VTERWSLIHDYLVEPIKIATQDASTRAEDAARALETYVKEWRKSKRTVIPLGKLNEIRRYAPGIVLRSRDARRLAVQSYIVGYGQPAGIVILAVAATVGIVGWASLEAVWVPGTGWPQLSDLGSYQFTARKLPGSSVVLLAAETSGSSNGAAFWDSNSGALLRKIVGEQVSYQGGYLIDVRNEDKTVRSWKLPLLLSKANDVLGIQSETISTVGFKLSLGVYVDADALVDREGYGANDSVNYHTYIYDLMGKEPSPIQWETTLINEVLPRPIVYRRDREPYPLLVLTPSYDANDNITSLSVFPNDAGISGVKLPGRLLSYARAKNYLAVVTQDGGGSSISTYQLESDGPRFLRGYKLQLPSTIIEGKFLNITDKILWTSGIDSGGRARVAAIYRLDDFQPLDAFKDEDAASGVINEGDIHWFYFINKAGTIRVWSSKGQSDGKIETGLKFENISVAAISLSAGSWFIIYDRSEKKIVVWNDKQNKREKDLDAADISGILNGGADDEFVVTLPNSSVEMFKTDGSSLGLISSIEGNVSLITRGYCSTTIWTDRGQVLRVFRRWRVFGFLPFGHGDCKDLPAPGG